MLKNVFKLTNLIKGIFILSLGLYNISYADISFESTLDYNLVPNRQVRYLPNYSNEYPFYPVTKKFTVKADESLDRFRVSFEGIYADLEKPKVKRAFVSYSLEDMTYSVGIVPYRISWCRADRDSVFIHDANNFCSFAGLAEMSSSAFGTQIVKSTLKGEVLTDIMLSAYKPSIDEQDKSLVIYKAVGKNLQHDKVGISLNRINFVKDNQLRVSLLKSYQIQESPTYERRMNYWTYYLGYEQSLGNNTEARISSSAYIGKQSNPSNYYTFRSISNTFDIIHSIDDKNKIALGYNQYSNKTKYASSINTQKLKVNSLHIAYRYDINKHTYINQQITHSKDYSIDTKGNITDRNATSYSLRLGFIF